VAVAKDGTADAHHHWPMPVDESFNEKLGCLLVPGGGVDSMVSPR
jgi:hypothetical protein